jgi:hypothetical protein
MNIAAGRDPRPDKTVSSAPRRQVSRSVTAVDGADARCGRRSSPIAPSPAGTPPCGPDVPNHPRPRPSARQCASSRRAAALAPLSAIRPLRRRYRPHGRCAAKQRNELAPPHSITSSAVAMSVGGTVRPSALAVLRLTASSYLIGTRHAGLMFRIIRGRGHQHADAPHPAGLLRSRRYWPHGRCAAKQRNELAPPCMTRKEHCEGRRGAGHDRTRVATGSPQPFRIPNRE